MKHQYFGDISDYKKYSVLRNITHKSEVNLLVCWMLTPEDLRSDGKNNGYLQKAEEWRHYEPDIFDFLHQSVIVDNIKNLDLVEEHAIVPNTTYFSKVLSDSLVERNQYFEGLDKVAKDCDIIFFDPDNGIAPKSIKKGRKNSSKYIFWDEIEEYWNKGFSLLIYQHFPRVNRLEYVNRVFNQMQETLAMKDVYALKTSYMAYFLLIQDKHKHKFAGLKNKIEENWGREIEVLYLQTSHS